ncbi:MAG TPA: hypothetical protein VFE47_20200 [Tepidisphaeraceae bacterium]|nr:hypothetical protein [Tepidisphaeraceae bacterium]
MTEALKCPDCSAPLDFPTNGGGTMRCPYCNSTVMVPGNYQSAGGERFAPPPDAAMQFAGVVRALQAGNKIEAIRIYRQIHGVDLVTAKNAVEKYAFRAQIGAVATPMYVSPMSLASGAYAAKVGFGIAAGIMLLVGAILTFTFMAVHRQIARTKPPLTPMPSFTTPTPKPLLNIRTAPPESAFAHVAMAFGSEGIGAGRFTDARSITNDGQGHIFVGEYSDGRVQEFDTNGKFLIRWSIPKGTSLLNLAADRKGTVYAIVPSHIYRYEALTGKLLGEVDNVVDGESIYYSDAYAALDGELYAIAGDHSVVDIDADGKIKRTLDLNEKVGEPVSFHRITVNGAGEMYLVEENKGIFKFAPDGRYINRFGGGHGHGPGRLGWPHAVATDGKGRVFVADNYRTVQVFDGEGGYLDSFGDNEISFCLSITDHDEVYVVARNRCSVRKYVLDKP